MSRRIKVTDADTGHVYVADATLPPERSTFSLVGDGWQQFAGPFELSTGGTTPPVEPPTTEPPVVSGGLFNPATGGELKSALQLALDQGYVLQCDARARPVISSPVEVKVNDRGTARHGLQGNGMQLAGAIPNGGAPKTLLTIELGSLQNRHLFVENVAFDDRSYAGHARASGLLLKGRRSVGENGLYSFVLSKLLFETMLDGLTLDGYVFEGVIDVPEATNCDRCVVFKMDAGNILSNVIVRTPLLRASRIGIDCEWANSIMITGAGSMIDITERSIRATNGVKLIDGVDFENAGLGYAVDIQGTDFPMRLLNLTGSNTDPNRGGVGMPRLIRYAGDPERLIHSGNRMNYQGSGVFTTDSTVS